MAKRPPDDSLRRDGRELSAWLGDLVSDDASQRIAAGEALQAMLYRVPSLQTDWEEIDWESLRKPSIISNVSIGKCGRPSQIQPFPRLPSSHD